MQHRTRGSQLGGETAPQVKRAHGNGGGHAYAVHDLRRNPNGEMGGNQPEALAHRDLHHTPRGVDRLVRAVGMLRYVESGRILVRQSGNGSAGLGIVALDVPVSHLRYIMTDRGALRQTLPWRRMNK